MTDKPEVHQISVEIHPPSPRLPAGQIARGYYTVVDDLLTMTDPKGEPATDETGKIYTHKLEPGDDAHVIAGRLTKELRSALRGKSAGPSNFGGPLNYPKNTGYY
jgi:hypothetical protein